jgi:putative ABC transport system ATP-binding protein
VTPVPVVVARGVRKTFEAERSPVRALRGVDLTLEEGEFVALMGPSGSGKSTFLNICAGLERADEGSVSLAGRELTALSDDDLARLRRHHIGVVFQSFNLLEHLTALENVALPVLAAGTSRRDAAETARARLDLLGLLDRADTSPASLSGGQRQRLAIARALANMPTVLLADEPTGSLDSEGEAEVLALFGRLNSRGQTILMVTHSQAVAAAASRTVRFRDGAVVDQPREASA